MPAVAPLREFRLYQASFLLRDYQWDVEDLNFTAVGQPRPDVDPKRAWADVHLRQTPIDVMRAIARRTDAHSRHWSARRGRDPQSAAQRSSDDLGQLRKLGIRAPEQAAPYILLDGRRPPQQLSLF